MKLFRWESKKGEVLGQQILEIKEKPDIKNSHTITMYIGSQNQGEREEYILSLKSHRIILIQDQKIPLWLKKPQIRTYMQNMPVPL